jgi:hypothetical protein
MKFVIVCRVKPRQAKRSSVIEADLSLPGADGILAIIY